jgi:hypothetical protein
MGYVHYICQFWKTSFQPSGERSHKAHAQPRSRDHFQIILQARPTGCSLPSVVRPISTPTRRPLDSASDQCFIHVHQSEIGALHSAHSTAVACISILDAL